MRATVDPEAGADRASIDDALDCARRHGYAAVEADASEALARLPPVARG
jgi:hypothetical protein